MERLRNLLLSTILASLIFQTASTFTHHGANYSVSDLSHLLEPIRVEHNAPALGGLVMNTTRNLAIGATGVRKIGTDVNVTSRDLWHLGSITKAMTATLVARLVEAGNISWEDTLGSVYSSLDLRPELRSINFLHLLSHYAGIPRNVNLTAIAATNETLQGQRLNTVKLLNSTDLLSIPGSQYVYSNWGYIIVGAMLEEVTGKTYEELMHREIFGPLNMTSAGFGVTCRSDEVTQPWPHMQNGSAIQLDNPLVVSPAGTVHCSLEDLGKFVRDHLRGATGLAGIVSVESYRKLHHVHFGSNYTLGWGYEYDSVEWARGPVLLHDGSNSLNFAMMVLDLTRGTAAVATSNIGNMQAAVNKVMKVMVEAVE